MRISGQGITPFNAKILPNFKPRTKLAIEWISLADGYYSAIDRGVESDIYEADITLYGKEQEIDNFINEIEKNRFFPSNFLQLSQFNDAEKIFGADLDYSSTIDVTLANLKLRKQSTWRGFSLSLSLRALPGFTFITPEENELPVLKTDIGYTGDSEDTIIKYDSYNGIFTFIDERKDAGIFDATFALENDDMAQARRFIATQRKEKFTISASKLPGVDNPFGTKRQLNFPLTCNIIDWEDQGMRNLNRWSLKLRLVEARAA